MNRTISRLGLTGLALVAGAVTLVAQTATTGGVNGVVTDNTGAPIAGATVRVTSSQVTRTAVTGADGSYRFGLLNPGTWQVSVSMTGVTTVTRSVNILTNSTQTLNIKAAKEGVATVVVVGAASTIDTSSTQTGMVTSMDSLSAIPVGRDMSSVVFLAPGVVNGGRNFGNNPSMGGGSAAENSYVVDGLSTTNTSRGFQGASLVTDFIDQVEIQTGGLKPEFSAMGGVVNAVTKSGTNEFKGSAWLTWDPIGIQAVPKHNDYFKQGSAPSRYDVGFEVSGALIKDKLFYFIGVDASKIETNEANNLPNRSGLKNGKETLDATQIIAKLNWYLTQDQQFTFSANLNDTKDDFPTAYPGTLGNAQFGSVTKQTVQNFVVNYDWTISPTLFFSAKLGTSQYETKDDPTDATHPSVTDYQWEAWGPGALNGDPNAGSGLAYSRGGTGYYVADDKTKTTQFKFDLSWFLGSHNMKFGYSNMNSKYSELAKTSGTYRDTINPGGSSTTRGNLYRTFLSTDATVTSIIQAMYAQDTWDVGAGLKVIYGFRFESQEQKDLHDKSFMKFDNFKDQVMPRVGFTWDLNGDGKSKLSGGYAKYFEQIPQRIAIRVFANETYIRYRYPGSQYTYDNATGAYALIPGAVYNRVTDFSTPFTNDPIAVGTKLPERNEYVLGYDHTFASGWTAGIHGKYREMKNPIEDMVFTDGAGNPYDEGPAIDYVGTPSQYGVGAAVLGNPGAFQQWRPNANSMTLYLLGLGVANPNGAGYNSWGIYIPDYYNPATGLFTVQDSKYPKAGNKYSSVDFTLDKKTDRDTLSFSYTWSRLEGNYEGVVSSSNGQADGNITASFDYYPYVGTGLLPLDRTHVVKLFASHRFDFLGGEFTPGVNWTYQSGTPISLFDDGSSSTPPLPDLGGYGNAIPQNGLLGQFGRSPALNNVDVHLGFSFKLGTRAKLVPTIDVFNAFNTRYASDIYQQATDQSANPDPRYGSAIGWQVGRRYRFGLKFQF